MIRDSHGGLYWSDHHICGYEGFCAEVLNVKAASCADFYRQIGFKMTAVR
ncbi:MAG: hypothetical protein ACLQVD_07245 [Capsulimonadaceae bacterium]